MPYTLLEEDRTLSSVKSAQSRRKAWWRGYPFLVRMQLAGSEYIGIHVSLCALAEILVLFENLPVEVADVVELFVRSILVAVDFILDLASCRRSRHHALDVEEVVAALGSVVIQVLRRNYNIRASHRGGWIAERDRPSELSVAGLFVEDVVSHLRARRLNTVLVEIGNPGNLNLYLSTCPSSKKFEQAMMH